jgi:hypothetical protein
VLYTDPGQGLALMRLFFWVEDGKLYIMHVERCS